MNDSIIPGLPMSGETIDIEPINETLVPPPGDNGYENGDAPPQGGMDLWMMMLIYGAIFVGLWFLMIRPQRKREKKMRELQSAITTGDNVITSGGFFGKVADVGEDCFIVEFGTNRGIRIPVLKGDVVGIREPKMTPQPKDAE
jgi:preprotein translocase subunit YajC